mgnify:CR=1 FL=1
MNNTYGQLFVDIAKSADLCLKPWIHSVISDSLDLNNDFVANSFSDILIRIESRDNNGKRYPANDLELEIYRSGSELNITIAWYKYPERPILWQGKHSLWMDSVSGKRCKSPENGEQLEALARRLRTSLSIISTE